MEDYIDFRQSTASPIAVDLGNKEIQDRVVSKTVKFASYTTNENAVWAGKQTLQKVSYPFAFINVKVNRNAFRLQVGDCFKFSYAPYNISNMICRVLQIEEAGLETEDIILHVMEDIFSVNNTITEYTAPIEYTPDLIDYTVTPLVYQKVIEVPYFLTGSDDIGVVTLAGRTSDTLLGYHVYMSADDGASYTLLTAITHYCCYGALVREYPENTYQIDDAFGIIVDFENDDIDQFETITRQAMLGINNIIFVGDEIMTVQNIDPITGGDRRYHLSGIYRGRFDSAKQSHASGAGLFLINGANIVNVSNTDILAGTDRKFKYVPYNSEENSSIADATAMDITISGRSRKPYAPINLSANGERDAQVAGYIDDIVLTWDPQLRGDGAGFSASANTDYEPVAAPKAGYEGSFQVEVWVADVLKRTVTGINAFTWTYTLAMNESDNGTLADEVVLKVLNYRDYLGITYESAEIEITVRR